MKKTSVFVMIAALMLVIGGAVFADTVVVVKTVFEQHHPNLAEAHRMIDKAYGKIVDAQKANEYELDGHAAKAKAYLEAAVNELKLAESVVNDRRDDGRDYRRDDGRAGGRGDGDR
jgi:hypothetical protein